MTILNLRMPTADKNLHVETIAPGIQSIGINQLSVNGIAAKLGLTLELTEGAEEYKVIVKVTG